jgi:Ni,Fe-hydrogenase maturation factor
MKIALVTFDVDGGQGIGAQIVSRIDPAALSPVVSLIDGSRDVLGTLQRLRGFDALIIVAGGSMGERPGTLRVFSINDLVLRDPRLPVTLHEIKVDTELLFAYKFFDLPPTTVVCVEAEPPGGVLSDTLLASMDEYSAAVTKAVRDLT